MPKIYEYRGIKFYIFSGDHEPSHVHIMKKGVFRLKMNIEDDGYEILWANKIISQRLIKRFKYIIYQNKAAFILKWEQSGDKPSQ